MNFQETYWPCAPDGFIPNSIVRELYGIKTPASALLKEEWKPPEWKSEWGKMPRRKDSDDDGFENRVRTWLSDDEDDADAYEISNGYTSNQPEKPLLKPTKTIIVEESKNNMTKYTPTTNRKEKETNITTNPLNKITSIQEENKLKLKDRYINEEQNKDGEQLIPYPFLQYYKLSWFPKNIGYDISTIISALIAKLKRVNPEDLSNMLQCIIKTHRFSPLKVKTLCELIAPLLEFLDDDIPEVRRCAVQALCELGINQQDIIMRLIPRLSDPSSDVREQVKKALKEIAGIIDAATLTTTLREFGKFKDMEKSCDVKVIESFQDLIAARRDAFRERLNQLYSTFGKKDAKLLAFVEYVTRPSKTNKLSKRGQRANEELSDRINIMKNNEIYSDYIKTKKDEDEELLQHQRTFKVTPDLEQNMQPLDTVDQAMYQPINTNESVRKKKRKDKHKSDIQTLEHVALATAIRALKEKRTNSIISSQEDIAEIFNDISLILHLLQEKNVKENSVIKERMEEVYNLQEKLGVFNVEDEEQNKEQGAFRYLISPSIRRHMVPGVIGERILTGLHVLPAIHKLGNYPGNLGVIKPIPERHGSATAIQNGCTNYGMFDYQWTTYTSSYDMGINVHHKLRNQDKYQENNFITYKNDRFGNFSVRPPIKIEGNDTALSEVPPASASHALNNNPILPEIKREAVNAYDEKVLINPAFPSTSEGTVH